MYFERLASRDTKSKLSLFQSCEMSRVGPPHEPSNNSLQCAAGFLRGLLKSVMSFNPSIRGINLVADLLVCPGSSGTKPLEWCEVELQGCYLRKRGLDDLHNRSAMKTRDAKFARWCVPNTGGNLNVNCSCSLNPPVLYP
jgi:hypothetical protein